METDISAPETTDPKQEASTLEDVKLFTTLKSWFMTDQEHSREWRIQARKDFDFAAGVEQWAKDTAKTMIDEGRPPITFNMVAPVLKAVAGVEINTRQEAVFLPRNVESDDLQANEALTEASNWMADGCNAPQQESQAFQDATKCGMGWVEERLDYELEPDGKYIEERIYPLEMFWDADARQMNIADAKRMWRARSMTLKDARAMFPDVEDDEDLHCSWALGTDASMDEKAVEERRLKLGDGSAVDPTKTMVTIIQCQWMEREPFNRVADPFTGELVNMTNAELKTLKERAKQMEVMTGQPLKVDSVQQVRRVYKTAFIGDKILKKGPNARPDGFTWHCITGETVDTKRYWVGLVAAMRDPQMMINKWLSQATHIINSTAKGGILVEKRALGTDINEFLSTYAKPQAVSVVKDGAISGGWVTAKPGAGLAAPYFNLIQMAMDAMPRVTGINMEMMGLRDVNQPGILEAQRKQAAMTILATLFDSLKGMRMQVARTRLHFIQAHLADGRLIRVLGQAGNHKTIRLIKDKVVGDYDVVIEEAPSSPNQKEQTWAALQVLIQSPKMQEMITPEIAIDLMEYVPGIPQTLISMFRKKLEAASQAAAPEQQKQAQLGEAAAVAQIDLDRAKAEQARAKAQSDKAKVALDAAALIGQGMKNITDQAKATASVHKTNLQMAERDDEMAAGPDGRGPQLRGLPELPTGPTQAPDQSMSMEPVE
jgi:hypothetical protein